MASEDLLLSFDNDADDIILFDSEADDLEIQGSEATPRQNSETQPGIGTTNYEHLTHKPSVNFVELIGNKKSSDLGFEPALEVISMMDIRSIFRRTIGG